MADIFIAHTKDDCVFAKTLAEKLEDGNVSSWYYERDNSLVRDPIRASRIEIENCRAFLIIISDVVATENYIDAELKNAYFKKKPLMAILSNVTEQELEKKFPDWAFILYSKTTIPRTKEIDKIANKIIENMRDLLDTNTIPPPKDRDNKSKLKKLYEFLLTANDRFYYILLLVLFTISFVLSVTIITQ